MTNVVFVGEFLWWVGGKPNLVISDELINYFLAAKVPFTSCTLHRHTLVRVLPI